MQIAQAVAGYSLGEADLLRRAMGKKKVEEMVQHRAIFQAGAEKQGLSKTEANRLFDLLERFANYGFNKSHSAAYGMISYQTAYLKTHYPVEFAAALLTVERGDSDKVAQYVADAQHLGVRVLPPDINLSRGDFTPVDDVVRFGLYGIKNVGEGAVDVILGERIIGGPFKDLFDFCSRIDTTTVNKRAIEHLIKAGAFDPLVPEAHRAASKGLVGTGRNLLLANLETAMKWGAAQREQDAAGQMSLFGVEEVAPPQLEPAPTLSELELLRFEKEALGLYISAHPMNSYPGLEEAATCSVDGLERYFEQNVLPGTSRLRVALAGIVQSVTKRPTRKGGMMARFELADESGAREVLVFGRTYDSVAPLLEEDAPVVVVVDVSDEGEGVRVVVDRLVRWDTKAGSDGGVPEVALLRMDLLQTGPHQWLELRSALDEHAGRTPVRLEFDGPGGRTQYLVEGVRVDAEALPELARSFEWVQPLLTVDKQALLAERARPAFGGRPQAPASEVPF